MGNAQLGGGAQIDPAEQEHRKIEILKRIDDFPVTLRETIDGYKEEDPESFLSLIEERLVDLLYGIRGDGLDCDRDTNDEIETAIRFFPHVLCERYWGTHPPIYAQLAYFKSVSFIPLLAKLGIELHQFQEEERGGLFYREWNVLRSLVNNDYGEWYDKDDEYQQGLIDEKYFTVIKSLGELGIFRKEDVLEEDLVWELSYNNSFPEKRFRYLVDFGPNCFYNHQHSVYKIWLENNDIGVFRIVFELGMLHFPKEIGYLFHLDKNDGYTPFDRACYEFGTETTTKIIGDVLATSHHYGIDSDDEHIHAVKAFMYTVTNMSVHLDGAYFLLRRDPGRYCHAIARK